MYTSKTTKEYELEQYVITAELEQLEKENANLIRQLREMRNSRDLEKEANKEITCQLAKARDEIARLRANLESIKRAASQTGRIAIANMAIAALEASDES